MKGIDVEVILSNAPPPLCRSFEITSAFFVSMSAQQIVFYNKLKLKTIVVSYFL
ncbi:hypothetical protein LEP1GSC172_0434 [Leptospira noguchii]|uniref:Uncharacterized protein n=1 Tax=Leptospira noguchii TaxID=28182 RepID=M6VE48_9LEPT|nr:hypothetical protein LEP1GSC172_0434 [Leptospira noguchii]